MFRKKEDDLMWLQQELLAADEDDCEEEYEEEYDNESEEEDLFGEDDETEEEEEEEEEELEEIPSNSFATGYGKGQPKKFQDIDFFDETDFDDGEILTKKEFKKAQNKKHRKNLGLIILAIVELLAIAAIALWWASWAL